MLVIAVNTLYATWQKRGTRRQLTGGVVVCVACALLLLVAIVWYNMRFNAQPGMLSLAEVEFALAYVALLGWFLPLGTCISFCLFASKRVVTTSVEIPRQHRRTQANPSSVLKPPRHQQGIIAPFVFDEDTPWCWLEYQSGRLTGQRLALKRSIVTIGREEDNDIWVDDEQASRYHAELAWDKGDVYLTDCDSLNGVLLNEKRIRGTETVEPGAKIEVASQRFLFILAEHAPRLSDSIDPLNNHVWHYSDEALTGKNVSFVPQAGSSQPVAPSFPLTPTLPVAPPFPAISSATPEMSFFQMTDKTPPTSIEGIPQPIPQSITGTSKLPSFLNMPSLPGIANVPNDTQTAYKTYPNETYPTQHVHTTDTPHSLGLSKLLSSPNLSLQLMDETQQTAPMSKTSFPVKEMGPEGMLHFRNGECMNKTYLLDRPVLTLGRDELSDIVVHDISISRLHAQFVRQLDGNYVQDLSSQNGTFVNEQLLVKPYLLQTGDIIRVGNISLQYVAIRQQRGTPLTPSEEAKTFSSFLDRSV